MLRSPAEAMYAISKRPRVVAPLLLISLFSATATIVMFYRLNAGEMQIRSIERTGRVLTIEDREVIRENSRSTRTLAIGFLSAFLGPILLVSIVTVIYFGIFTILGREAPFKAFLAVTSFAFLPLLLRQLAGIVRALVSPETSLLPDEIGSISAALLLDPNRVSPTIYVAAGLVDVVTVWILALLVIGFRFLVRRSVGGVWVTIVVLAPFLAYAGLRLALAAMNGF